jgi:protein SCO1/2
LSVPCPKKTFASARRRALAAMSVRTVVRRALCDNSLMTRGYSWLGWGLAAASAALAGFWVAHQVDSSVPPLASGTWFPTARATGEFVLTSDTGRAFTARDLQGHPTLVFFGYTHCPDVCPTTLVTLAAAKKSAALPDLRVLFVSVDPGRDTPAALALYVHAFDPDFTGATGDALEIARIAQKFGVAVARVDLPGGDYMMDHSAAVFLLDRRAQIVAVFTPPFEVAPLAADLRRIAPRLHG